MESFWSTLKREELVDGQGLRDARRRPRRRSSSTSRRFIIARDGTSALGYVSPEQFEAALN